VKLYAQESSVKKRDEKMPQPPERRGSMGLKEKLAARRRQEKARRRKRLIRVAVIAAAAIIIFLILFPFLRVMWYINRAQSSDSNTRKYALQWLAERRVKKAVPVFIKALEGTAGDSESAMVTLRTLTGKEIIPQLVNIWESQNAPAYAKYNALQLIAEKGDKTFAPLFVNTHVLTEKGWDSAWDFLRRNADESIVQMIVAMLSDTDVLKRRAAAKALRPIKEMSIVKENEAALNALVKAVADSDPTVRLEALITILGIARPKDFEPVENALLKDQDPWVRFYAANVLGELRDPCAISALVRSLRDPEGNVCRASADALIKIANFDCVSPLGVIILDDKEDALARVQAIGVLRRISAPGAAQILACALTSTESLVAIEAARSLASVGTPESVDALARATKSPVSDLRTWSAYALGLIAQHSASAESALLALLRDGDLSVVKAAVQSLLIIGDASTAQKVAQIFGELDPQSENLRQTVSLLASYRTPEAISILVNTALSAYPALREEARLELNTMGLDILSNVEKKRSYTRETLLSCAQRTLNKEAGSKLATAIESLPAQTGDEIGPLTSAVLKTVRELPENIPDRDALKEALLNARTFYWTAALIESLKAAGIAREKIISLSEELVALTSEAELFEKFPTEETASKLRKIAKELSLPPSQDK
jgi:HEAT repeat protein